MILTIPIVEELHYELKLQIDDDLWEKLKDDNKLGWEILGDLIQKDDEWLGSQCAEAACAACIDCSTTSVHSFEGVYERYVNFPSWVDLTSIEAACPEDDDVQGISIPDQRSFLAQWFGEDNAAD